MTALFLLLSLLLQQMLEYLSDSLLFTAELFTQSWGEISGILFAQTGCEIYNLRGFHWLFDWWQKWMTIRLELWLLLGLNFFSLYLYLPILLLCWQFYLHAPMQQIVPRPLTKLPLKFPDPILKIPDNLLFILPVHHSKLYCKNILINTTWSCPVRITSGIGSYGVDCRPSEDWPCDRLIRERRSSCRGGYMRRCGQSLRRRLWSLCACS